MSELPERQEEERGDDALTSPPGEGEASSPRSSSLVEHTELEELERLDERGDFARYTAKRRAISGSEGWDESSRARLEVLDAQHGTDPLARRMLSVSVMVLIMLAIKLWWF